MNVLYSAEQKGRPLDSQALDFFPPSPPLQVSVHKLLQQCRVHLLVQICDRKLQPNLDFVLAGYFRHNAGDLGQFISALTLPIIETKDLVPLSLESVFIR